MSASLVADRYEVVRPLGKGSFAHTLLAHDRQSDRQVALKVLSPRDVSEWKTYELFDRETAVLRTLRHSGIPAVYDSFRASWNGSEAAWLAMEYIEGTTLADCIAQSASMEATAIRRVFMEVLNVLDYLHTRVPPVLHRDIKPANIILRPNGTIALVDFGSVRNVFHSPDEHASTIVGTYGYMPYEQYMGQASPASDLYSAAATMLHLITGRPPSEWMTDEGRVQVPEQVTCGEPLRSVLVRLLAPAPTERYQSAREVIDTMLSGAVPLATLSDRSRSQTTASLTMSRRPSSPPVPVMLPPAPRPIEGETATLLRTLSYSSWQLMTADRDPNARPSTADLATIAFFSVLTAGILPIVMWSYAHSRKRRMKQFLVAGIPAVARVLDMEKEDIGFDVHMTQVRYEFEADGRVHRDVDGVLPSIAARWDPGDWIQIVYLPDRDYDSVIVSTR